MADPTLPIYPLTFKPIYKEKIWGGRTLEKLGRTLPGDPETPIGESWELADLAQTSVSGGGGGAERSVIANGPLAGKTLADAIREAGADILGGLTLTPDGGFPILLKFLDARQHLSVQVHPSQAYAKDHHDAFLKSEAWYILAADPGAVIYKGVKQGVTPEQFREAIEQDRVEPLLITVPVKPGDCHYLPSGTCHALGAGVLVAEVQTPSDTTFRVYDWGRTGRELHVDQAIECIDFGPPDVSQNEPNTKVQGAFAEITRLVACEYFRIDRYQVDQAQDQVLSYSQPVVWMVLEGNGSISCDGAPDVSFGRGQTLYIPPGMRNGKLHVVAGTTWLEVTFPQADPSSIA
jgi:mannose-6-phosphate isomerase